MSSSNPNSDTEAYGNSSAASDHRHHHDSGVGTSLAGGVAARVSPPGKHRLAPVRHGAAAAASAGVEGVPPSAFRRRGWSSSKLALSGVDADAGFTGRRRASEDLAVSVKVCVVGGAVGGAVGHSRRVDYAAFNSNATAAFKEYVSITPAGRYPPRGHTQATQSYEIYMVPIPRNAAPLVVPPAGTAFAAAQN